MNCIRWKLLQRIAWLSIFVASCAMLSQQTPNQPDKPNQKTSEAPARSNSAASRKPIDIQKQMKELEGRLAVFKKLAAQGKTSLSPTAAGKCSDSNTPCCCQIGSPPAACMTKDDCAKIGGRCNASGIGCD